MMEELDEMTPEELAEMELDHNTEVMLNGLRFLIRNTIQEASTKGNEDKDQMILAVFDREPDSPDDLHMRLCALTTTRGGGRALIDHIERDGLTFEER